MTNFLTTWRVLGRAPLLVGVALLAACSKEPTKPDATTGTLRVSVTETGAPSDPNGYELRVGNSDPVNIFPGTHVLTDLEPGEYSLTLSGAWVYCHMSAQGAGELNQTLSIAAGDTTATTIDVTCGEALRSAIVYSALRNNTRQVYAMWGAGTGEARVTQDLGRVFGPFMSVASDGTKFVHVTGGPDVTNLEVVSSTGNVLGTVPTSIPCPTTPAWSPDGARIAFSPCGAGAIRVINANGTGEVVVPNTFGYTPSWTADGTRLVYVEVNGDQSHLVITSIDGSSRAVLTSMPGELVSAPDVSPDGSKIVFARQIGLMASDVYLYAINIDGTGERLLVGEPGYKTEPRWSPDGEAVIYRQDVPAGLWRVSANGGTPVVVLSESNLADLAWTR